MRYGWTIEPSGEQLARFQDWHANVHFERFFANVYGDAIAATISTLLPLKGALVVDYGAGPGFLTKKLVRKGASVFAVDVSPESLQKLKNLCPEVSKVCLLTGGRAQIDDGVADLVVLTEVIEHLTSEELMEVVRDCARLLKPGGLLFVTCPNDENLMSSTVCCPNCGGAFHPVLHKASFDQEALRSLLVTFGFAALMARPTAWRSGISGAAREWVSRVLLRRKLPFLVAAGRKGT